MKIINFNTCPTPYESCSVAKPSNWANGIIARKFITKIKILFQLRKCAINPKGSANNNTLLLEEKIIFLKDSIKDGLS